MSFGASPSDIIIVVTFCKALYRKCRSAGGEYDEISREVRALHTVLRHLKIEVEAPESPLNRDSSLWGRQLAPIIGDCDFTLRQLDGLLMKYGRLSNNGGGNSPSSPRILWDRMKFGSNEMDQLGGIRVKLISHKTSLTLFLDTIQLRQSGKMASTLDNHGGQLDVILDKVDKIATKMQQRSGSVMTNYEDDDKEVWKDFRRELIAEGFSSDVLQHHKDILRAYIREIEQQGLLDNCQVDSTLLPPPVGQHTERWLASVQAPSEQFSTLVGGPPSFSSLNTPIEAGAKVMLGREENMKFPQSMKMQRAKPESLREALPASRQLAVPGDKPVTERRISGESQRQPSPTPRSPVPRQIAPEDKPSHFVNTDGSSESDSETDNSSRRRSQSPAMGQIITTSSLLAMSQTLTLHSHSPSSFRSQNSYFEEAAPRLPQRPKQKGERGVSPQPQGAILIPKSSNNDRLGTSPRPEPIHLAPDSKGKPILQDAKWTKISRRLVSPEVLDQAHKRYEARPDFVAVLGVLSRSEIEDLAARSQALREARRRRHFPPEVPPPQPPRPSVAIPFQRAHSGRDTPSSESSESDSDLRHRQQKPLKGILKNNYTHQQYQQGPPSPAWSPASAERQPMFVPQGNYRERPSSEREREREREPRQKHKHHSNHHREKENPDKGKKKKLINGENLTFAGIGGAAVSLLHVLSEAAEGL